MNVFHRFKAPVSLILAVILIGLSFPVPSQATITATAVIAKGSYKSWTITCAEADTSGTITHGFVGVPPTAAPGTSVAPDMVIIVPVNATIAAAGTVGVTTSTTVITITKANAVGSCGATPGTTIAYKVIAWRPASIAQ
jgi:hypothetical protein